MTNDPTSFCKEGDTRKIGAHKLAAQIAGEPKAARGMPPCPRHLRGRARAAWNFWREELIAMGLDCRSDAQMLEGACVAYEAAVTSYETIHKQGRLIAKRALDPKTGQLVVTDVRAHPVVAMGNDPWTLLRSLGSEFGLSRVSRSRLSIDRADSGDDDLMKILTQPRPPKTGIVQCCDQQKADRIPISPKLRQTGRQAGDRRVPPRYKTLHPRDLSGFSWRVISNHTA